MGHTRSIGRNPCVLPAGLLMLAGCNQASGPAGAGHEPSLSAATLSGHVTHPDRLEFPQGASVNVRLVELGNGASSPPVQGIVVAERRIVSPGNTPVFFVLSYDPDKVSSLKSYALEASVVRGEVALWTSATGLALETGKLKSGGYRGADAQVVLARHP